MAKLILATLVLCVIYYIFLQRGVYSIKNLMISLGAPKRRAEDASSLQVSPSEKLKPLIDTLTVLGFARLGEASIKLPSHPTIYEFVFVSPDRSVTAETTDVMPDMTAFSTAYANGAVVETNFPMGEKINRSDYISHTITTNVEAAYHHHIQQIADSNRIHGEPIKIETLRTFLEQDGDFRKSHLIRKLSRHILIDIVTISSIALGMAMTVIAGFKLFLHHISIYEIEIRFSELIKDIAFTAILSYFMPFISVWSSRREEIPSPATRQRQFRDGCIIWFPLILLGISLLLPRSEQVTMRDYSRAVNALNVGNNEEALAYANLVVEYLPDYVPAYTLRGLAYQRLYMFDQALDDFDQATRLEAYDAKAFYNRGLAQQALGFYDLAIGDFAKAIRLQPDEPQYYYARGIAYRDQGNYRSALEDINEAIRLDLLYKEAYYGRGLTYYELGDYTHALSDIKESLRLDPLYANAYYLRGRIHEAQGDLDGALVDYSRAIEIDPRDSAEAYYARGLVFYSRGNMDQSISDYSEAIQINPTYSPDYYYARGRAYYDHGHYDMALSDMHIAIKYESTNAVYYYFRGLIYAAQNDYEEAIKDYTQTINLDPIFEDAYYARALAYQTQHYNYEAIQDFQKVLQMTSNADRVQEIQEHLEELGFTP